MKAMSARSCCLQDPPIYSSLLLLLMHFFSSSRIIMRIVEAAALAAAMIKIIQVRRLLRLLLHDNKTEESGWIGFSKRAPFQLSFYYCGMPARDEKKF